MDYMAVTQTPNRDNGLTKEQAARRRLPIMDNSMNHPDVLLLQELRWMLQDMVAGRRVMNANMLMIAASRRLSCIEEAKAKHGQRQK